MSKATQLVILTLTCSLVYAESSHAQHALELTRTVDPSGSADFRTINGAIGDVPDDPSDPWTILIYAGTYDEAVALDSTKENVDLVGIDRDAVIIAPSSGNGITITSGTETTRNNTIRNLTIKTATGHGIEIVRGGNPGDNAPKDILIDAVTISAGGAGVTAPEAENLTIHNCTISSSGGFGVAVTKPTQGSTPTGFTLSGSRVSSTGSGNLALVAISDDGLRVLNSELTSASNDACSLSGADDLEIRSCSLIAGNRGLFLQGFAGVTVLDTVVQSVGIGIETSELSGTLRAANCSITAHGDNPNEVRGIRIDNSTVAFLFERCRIESVNDGTGAAIAAFGDAATVSLQGCDLIARNESTSGAGGSGGPAIGIDHTNVTVSPYTVIGGSIVTSAASDRQVQVYDIQVGPNLPPLSVSGTEFSKWTGSIDAAKRSKSISQRVLGVTNGSATATLGATPLTPGEQAIQSGFNQPDVYRALSVKGNQAGMDQTVIIIGTNWAGAQIAEGISVNGINEVAGNKPFLTIKTIVLPAENGSGETVSVGRTNKLGLHDPLFEDADVIEWSKLDTSSNSYVVQDLSDLTVDATRATVDPGSFGASPASFQFSLLTP